jgi:hypothetical protein
MVGQFTRTGKRRRLLTGVAAEFYRAMDEEENNQIFWILQAGMPAPLFKLCHRVSGGVPIWVVM